MCVCVCLCVCVVRCVWMREGKGGVWVEGNGSGDRYVARSIRL